MRKHYTRLLTLALLTSLMSSVLAQTTLISQNSTWKYHDGNTDQSTAMTDTTFNDASWSSGSGVFGIVGEITGATITTAISNNITTYFRKKVVLTSRQYSSLELNVVCDDGFVAYLNGNEIQRYNVGTAPVTFATVADATISGGEEGDYDNYVVSIDTSDLVIGDNYITVQLKNRSGGSSDIGFDMELIAQPYVPPGAYTINSGDDWDYLDDGNAPTTGWNSDTSWTIPGAWSNGPSLLGYGTIDGRSKATNISTAANPAAYFRTTFDIADTTAVNYLDLDYVRDDGIVIYINGIEVFRNGMPTGTITNATFANQTIGNADEGAWNNTVIATSGILHQGKNVIAARVHQVNAGSSDVGFDLRFQAVDNIQASLDRNPYVQNTTESSAVIMWRTNIPITGSVRFGTVHGVYSSSVDSSITRTEHTVKISGLSPDTKYYYHLSTNGIDTVGRYDSTYFFKTAPTPGDKTGKVGFWVLGDGGQAGSIQTGVHQSFLNTSFRDNMDMILMLGDNAYNVGSDEEFNEGLFDTQLDSVIRNTPMYSCVGNHEVRYATAHSISTPESTPYYQIYDFPTQGEGGGLASGTESYFSWDYGNVHFISINAEEEDLDSNSSTMWSWCEDDLQQNTMDWTVVIVHQGPYTKGSHNSDTENEHVEFRENFLPLLERYGVDITLSGHSHSYERSKLLKGHFDVSTTYSASTHDVDGGYGRMPGSGSLTNDCAYEKVTDGPTAGHGAIYSTAGSSSKISGGSLDHPAMKVSLNTGGSVYVEVNDNKLSWWYIEQNGDTTDYLQILKDTDFDSTHVLTDSTVTLTASWPEGPYVWSNGATTRSITTTLGQDTSFYVQNISGSAPCMIDTFRVDFPALARYITEIDTTGIISTDVDGSMVVTATARTEADADGWYYYAHPSDPNALFFAVRNSTTGGNTLPIDNVIQQVEIRSANRYDRIKTSGDSFLMVMGYDWNVVPVNQPNGGMDIKFYYDPVSLADFTTTADSIEATNTDLVSTRTWFKASQGSGTSFLNADISIDSVANFTDLTSSLVSAPNYTTGVGQTDGIPWVDRGNGKNYIQFNGLTSFSGGSLSQSLYDPSPVPVSWLAFNVSWIGSNTQLIWQTATESNTSHFEVQRLDESGNFVSIATIPASINSSSILTYQYEDITAKNVKTNTISYRIKLTDLDGSISYSTVESISSETKGTISIYPNPARESITVSFLQDQLSETATLHIYNENGQEVMNTLLGTKKTHNVSLRDINSGNYIVVIKDKREVYTYKLIKE